MPTVSWLKKEFAYGYDSGNVLTWLPSLTRYREEKAIGGSYRKVFRQGLAPHLKANSRVLELGPGKGSWSRAILSVVTTGELQTADYLDVRPWLKPEHYGGRMTCHQVADNTFHDFPDGGFDVFWSFGVLCHNNIGDIEEILANGRRKMKPGAIALHQHGDWEKLDAYGWQRGRVPESFRELPDAEIWWPRNDQALMARAATRAGWEVLRSDLGLVARDSMILLRNSAAAEPA